MCYGPLFPPSKPTKVLFIVLVAFICKTVEGKPTAIFLRSSFSRSLQLYPLPNEEYL